MQTKDTEPEGGTSPLPLLPPIGWAVSAGLTPYADALAAMEQRASAIRKGSAGELIWLLEHPALYTSGTSAKPQDLLIPDRFPVFETGRGGQFTYHGPGQRVAYVMLDLRSRFAGDIHRFVATLEAWLITALADLGIAGEVRAGRVGVWVTRTAARGDVEDKIAALGIRVRAGVSFHGISLNVSPDLSHYDGIVPCGLSGHGVTSISALGGPAEFEIVDAALRRAACLTLGSIENATSPL